MDNRTAIVNGPITKTLFHISWPMIVAFLLQTSFNIIDGIFVGSISPEALAAVTLAFPIFFILLSIAGGIGMGATSLIAQMIGAKKNPNKIANQSITLGLTFGILITIIGLFAIKPLFTLMSATDEVLTLAIQYTNIILIGSTTFFMIFIGNSILRGEGNTKIPMYAMGGSAILNIFLDSIFILGLGLGVQGAALATIIARTCGATFMIYYLFKKSIVRINLKWYWNTKIIKNILRIGVPASFSQLLMGVNMLALTTIIAPFGANALASYGIGFRLESFVMMPIIGVMTAVIPLVGQNYGAKKFDRMQKFVNTAMKLALIWGFSIGLIFIVFAKYLASIFSSDPVVIQNAVNYLQIMGGTFMLFGPSTIILGGFVGKGKAIQPLIVQLTRLIVISIPLAIILSKAIGLKGVWIAMATSYVISSIVAYIWWRIENKDGKKRKITFVL